MTISYKEKAVFGKENRSRISRIIEAKRDYKKLSEISPSFIVADLTWRCNYNCLNCIEKESISKDGMDLPVEIIEDLFDYSNRHEVRGIMTMGGEVFLHKKGIKKCLEKSVEYQIPLKTVTNGSCLKNHIEEIVEAFKIPGSILRVSVNMDREHYKMYTRGNVDLKKILDTIEEITSKGTAVYVSTVVFPDSSKRDGNIPNINQLDSIVRACEKSRINTHIFIPARDPISKEVYSLNSKEKKELKRIKQNKHNLELELDDFLNEKRISNQNLDFRPCPSGFLFATIGSDGKVYKCTNNRSRESMVLGEITKRGDFEKFWHSEERVKKQMKTKCQNKECTRYKINVVLDAFCETSKRYGISLLDYVEIIDYTEIINSLKKLRIDKEIFV